ncbi:1130_t:CDS:1 [Paraglomus occultum]|uniref:1130_t:CDS:1 n=1 Tax=Paraglomus occultum TaxID=144539 RepID=A0A9N9CPW9_9GLOM|nr:1130_t:CDS:1 [Paraglomus occultum]
MARKEKKNTTCERCGKSLSTPQRLREHRRRKNPCKPIITENLLNEEFQRLANITGDYEKNLVFREQELGPALKRRAIAVYNANIPRYHPDNGSDVRKMLESQRKSFRELLEKEFDKRGQFKFALCSLTKFIMGDKPGNKDSQNEDASTPKQRSSKIDWLRNKQIIVYNRSEIDNYLSDAFEQILHQVEERGGKTNV